MTLSRIKPFITLSPLFGLKAEGNNTEFTSHSNNISSFSVVSEFCSGAPQRKSKSLPRVSLCEEIRSYEVRVVMMSKKCQNGASKLM